MDGLLIGRFQPFHLGHLDALRFALSRADRLWVGLGSSNRKVERDNPFTAQEREEMILSSIDDSVRKRIAVYPIPDLDNHVRWIESIDSIVPKFDVVFSNDQLTEHLYSRRSVSVLPIPFLNREVLSGTNIRGMIAKGQGWEELVPEGTRNFLVRCNARDRLKDL